MERERERESSPLLATHTSSETFENANCQQLRTGERFLRLRCLVLNVCQAGKVERNEKLQHRLCGLHRPQRLQFSSSSFGYGQINTFLFFPIYEYLE